MSNFSLSLFALNIKKRVDPLDTILQTILDNKIVSLDDVKLQKDGINLVTDSLLAIRQLATEEYNPKTKEDLVFLLACSTHKLPLLCTRQINEEERKLLENEVKLTIKAFLKVKQKFPHIESTYSRLMSEAFNFMNEGVTSN